MAELFDLLEIELRLVEPYRFEGTGSIPIPDNPGEVSEEGPQHPYPNLPTLKVSIRPNTRRTTPAPRSGLPRLAHVPQILDESPDPS